MIKLTSKRFDSIIFLIKTLNDLNEQYLFSVCKFTLMSLKTFDRLYERRSPLVSCSRFVNIIHWIITKWLTIHMINYHLLCFFHHFVLSFVVTPVMSLVGCIKILFKISNLYRMTNIIEDRIIIIYFRILTAATQFECNLLCVTDCLFDRHEWFCWCCCCLYFLFTTRYAWVSTLPSGSTWEPLVYLRLLYTWS